MQGHDTICQPSSIPWLWRSAVRQPCQAFPTPRSAAGSFDSHRTQDMAGASKNLEATGESYGNFQYQFPKLPTDL